MASEKNSIASLLGSRPPTASSSVEPAVQKQPAAPQSANIYQQMYYQQQRAQQQSAQQQQQQYAMRNGASQQYYPSGYNYAYAQQGYPGYAQQQQQQQQQYGTAAYSAMYNQQYNYGYQYGQRPTMYSSYPGYQMPVYQQQQAQQQTQKKTVKKCRWARPLEKREIAQFYTRYEQVQRDKSLHVSNVRASGFSNFSDIPQGFVGTSASAESFVKDNQGESWPLNLTRFVQKAFAKCVDQEERGEIYSALKVIIDTAKIGAALYSKNWDLVPVPKLKRENTPLLPPSTTRLLPKPNPTPHSNSNSNSTLTHHNHNHNHNRNHHNSVPPPFSETPPPLPSSSSASGSSSKFQENVKRRKERFGPPKPRKSAPPLLEESDDERHLEKLAVKVVGVSEALEKPYLRLTGPPDPEAIRPPRVLQKSLEMLERRWTKGGREDYPYICEQLRSIRQDLVVQGIRDALTVRVYETHARYALQAADLDHFNQCQSMLKTLHSQVGSPNKMEFIGYGVLYQVLRDIKLEIPAHFKDLPAQVRVHPFVKHSFSILRALHSQNFLRFFKLYRSAPNYAGQLIEVFIPRVRARALQTCAKSQQAYFIHFQFTVNRPRDPRQAARLLGARRSGGLYYGRRRGAREERNRAQLERESASFLEIPHSRPAFLIIIIKMFRPPTFRTFANIYKRIHKKKIYKWKKYPCIPEWLEYHETDPFLYKLRSKEEVMRTEAILNTQLRIEEAIMFYPAGDHRVDNNTDLRETIVHFKIPIQDFKFSSMQKDRFAHLVGPRLKDGIFKLTVRQFPTYDENLRRAYELIDELYFEARRAPMTDLREDFDPYYRNRLKRKLGRTKEEREQNIATLSAILDRRAEEYDRDGITSEQRVDAAMPYQKSYEEMVQMLEDGKARELSMQELLEIPQEATREIGDEVAGVSVEDLKRDHLIKRIKHRTPFKMHANFIEKTNDEEEQH